MSLVNVRAAFETAILNTVNDEDPTVTVVFDNTPFTQPGKTKKYIMVNLDFTQSTLQPHGEAKSYYAGTIRCAVMSPSNKGSAVAAAISELLITALTSVNKAAYTDTFSVTPRVSAIEGPTSVNVEEDSHYLAVVSCDFTANA